MKDEPHARILRERLALAMPRVDVARGAGMVRGAEVLRCRTGDAACTVDLARGRARPKVWRSRGADGSTGTTRPRRSGCGEKRVSSIAYFGN
jgi:hypothetical protein